MAAHRKRKGKSPSLDETLPNKQDSFEIKKYNEVVRSAELVDIRMTSSKFSVMAQYFGDEKTSYKFSAPGHPTWVTFDTEHRFIVGSFDWVVTCKMGRKTALSIKATYLVTYRLSDSAEEFYAKEFVANVGRFAVFPYFRALVSYYSYASSTDLPILPVLKQQIVTSSDEDS